MLAPIKKTTVPTEEGKADTESTPKHYLKASILVVKSFFSLKGFSHDKRKKVLSYAVLDLEATTEHTER